jgi:hypothetical protein
MRHQPLLPNARKQFFGGLVFAALGFGEGVFGRDEFATEGFGEGESDQHVERSVGATD